MTHSRRYSISILCLGVAIVCSILLASRACAEDWGAFLGPRGDGTSLETGVDPAIWNPHPPILWTMPLGVSYGAPSIVGKRLLQFDRFGPAERLTCFDVDSAQEMWRWEADVEYSDMYGYNNGPRCSPVVSDDLVFVYGVAGQLSCVELATGKLLWTKDTLRDYGVVQNFFGVASTPVVFEDKLLVMVGGSPPQDRRQPNVRLDLARPNGTAIVAFDTRTGDEVYRLGDDLASYTSMTIRNIEGKPTGLAFLRSGLIAFDPARGTQLFQFPWRAGMLESVNASVPVTQDNNILLSEAYEVGSVLLNVKSSKPTVVWKDEGQRRALSFRAHWSTPIVVDGYLYGGHGRNPPDSDLRCIRLRDGNVQWTERNRGRGRASVTAVDGYLIVLGETGLLELIKPNPDRLEVLRSSDLSRVALTGDTAAVDTEALVSQPCWAAPVISNGKLFIRGDRRLVCFELIPQ